MFLHASSGKDNRKYFSILAWWQSREVPYIISTDFSVFFFDKTVVTKRKRKEKITTRVSLPYQNLSISVSG